MSAFAGEGLGCIRGERVVFADLSFRVDAGDALVLTGANGSGKSSLLRLMAGLAPPAAGRLTWDGVPVAEDPESHRARLRWIGHADAVKPALTARENALFWARLAGAADPAATVSAALDRLALAAIADSPARWLSQGQRRRLALARLLAAGPASLWLLDEPTVGLDGPTVASLEELLAGHRAAGGIVVASTHVPIALPGAAQLALVSPPAADAEE
ncbi:MAG: cytochrome c biogenesis heme-transporting ATPase CcmA [Alphaproteobacteria bacterium]